MHVKPKPCSFGFDLSESKSYKVRGLSPIGITKMFIRTLGVWHKKAILTTILSLFRLVNQVLSVLLHYYFLLNDFKHSISLVCVTS